MILVQKVEASKQNSSISSKNIHISSLCQTLIFIFCMWDTAKKTEWTILLRLFYTEVVDGEVLTNHLHCLKKILSSPICGRCGSITSSCNFYTQIIFKIMIHMITSSNYRFSCSDYSFDSTDWFHRWYCWITKICASLMFMVCFERVICCALISCGLLKRILHQCNWNSTIAWLSMCNWKWIRRLHFETGKIAGIYLATFSNMSMSLIFTFIANKYKYNPVDKILINCVFTLQLERPRSRFVWKLWVHFEGDVLNCVGKLIPCGFITVQNKARGRWSGVQNDNAIAWKIASNL